MKLVKIFSLALILLTTAFVSCKKEKEERAYIMQGNWEGSIRNTGSPLSGFFGIRILPGNKLERYNSSGVTKATGTWELKGTSFSGTYTYEDDGTVLTVVGTLNKEENKLSGTYQNDGNGTGTWSATKK